MSEFKFNELIECAYDADFKDAIIVRYLSNTSEITDASGLHPYLAMTRGCSFCCYPYARKIEPKVMILLYLDGGTARTSQISRQLADKIMAGDV
jgi:hypothetical protein